MFSFKVYFCVMKTSIFPGLNLALFLSQLYDFQVIYFICVSCLGLTNSMEKKYKALLKKLIISLDSIPHLMGMVQI